MKGNPGRGGKQPGAGRPPVGIDKGELEKLCSLQCTQDEIAAYFKVSRRTIETYAQKEDYRPIFEQARELGKISVRRKQYQLLEQGNVTMAIWLGKQVLGQKDRYDVGHGGVDGKPLLTLATFDAIVAAAEHESEKS